FGSRNISPVAGVDTLPTLMAADQKVDVVHSPLYVKAVALSDGVNTVAIIAVDLLDLRESDFAFLDTTLRQELDFAHVIITVTHTHSGFFDDHKLTNVRNDIIDAARDALTSMQPVQIDAA